ncbi:carboxylase:pyruvate/acetyl-CoA/propionyl-CoA [Coprinopsis cinerea okayama7|uniref:Carboxylase:pyruvate/acetyl-CoA/propionyl-CoA n=1 Tax=Coprinopsis cinerea (strain Okayama-7 / 130 / ATCC MYA-4618 / FGSC 9003) TaxID=240176 RepID=A8P5J7_COPC7|nr:carboxylase:pyruvate/acetyl-CoA/propionyl-CoA [Coprinopsis cinerea okayama7\|eukprot:XP_001838959.2 carboxylase:pyruvate/acetyl-CoA/propionyl-CoA [Coprinopsis cinerea okayama7\
MPKVLVANRGEIAVYTEGDANHASYAQESVKLEGASDFLNVAAIAKVAQETKCTHVHPGYGFLSENPSLPEALASLSPPVVFIGPSKEALRLAGDKMLSRELSTSLGVQIAPGTHVKSAADVLGFGKEIGYPVMIKALDGGGGRGIRVVNSETEVEEAFKRCLGESPSKQVFAEKALTGPGWKHIEVQIIGDGTGSVNHLWERECSVQRRFQKVVEVAPSRLSRAMVQPLLDASITIARHLKYHGLGTFEYLVDAKTGNWVFLEINPRVQVEHTITEEVNDVDLVRAQLQLFTNKTLKDLNLDQPFPAPQSSAIQLRLTAEDPLKSFQLSPGTIRPSDVIWPAGRGIRIDTWLSNGPYAGSTEWIVGTEFDSLLAKIIVRASSFEEMNQKALRALAEFSVGSTVQTNLPVLAGVVAHPDWNSGNIDTLWLERNLQQVLDLGAKSTARTRSTAIQSSTTSNSTSTGGQATAFLQPGALFHLTLSPTPSSGTPGPTTKHTLTLSSIGQNAFPDALSGTLQTSLTPTPFAFSLAQSSSAAVDAGSFELADPNNPAHVGTPLTGKIVELHPALVDASKTADDTGGDGDVGKRRVRKGETVLVLSVMKMENSIVAPFDGYISKVGKGIRVGVVVGEGVLVCVVDDGKGSGSRL